MKTVFNYLILVLIALIIFCFTGEVFLRIFWSNPYSVQPIAQHYPGFVRLQLPNVDVQYNIKDLYPERSVVRFRTNQDGSVFSTKTGIGPVVHFYGGSTTETRYIAEGYRWPELILGINGKNWGVSGNHLLDSVLNFEFHLLEMPPPDYAVFMHAINDFSARNMFQIDSYLKTMGQSRRSNIKVGERFYLLDFIKTLHEIWFGESNVKEKIKQNITISKSRVSALNEKEFLFFLDKVIKPFLENRTKVLENLLRVAQNKNVKIVLLTQPHSYGLNFIPLEGEDLRDRPLIDGPNYLTHEQMGTVLDLINENTRSFAKSHEVLLIDVSSVFASLDVSEFFYDGIHYTERGSLTFGQIVNSHAPWKINQGNQFMRP